MLFFAEMGKLARSSRPKDKKERIAKFNKTQVMGELYAKQLGVRSEIAQELAGELFSDLFEEMKAEAMKEAGKALGQEALKSIVDVGDVLAIVGNPLELLGTLVDISGVLLILKIGKISYKVLSLAFGSTEEVLILPMMLILNNALLLGLPSADIKGVSIEDFVKI